MTLEIVKTFNIPGAPEHRSDVEAPITEITITENQADVKRESAIKWSAGTTCFLVMPVTPYAVDSTLWSEIVPEEGLSRPDVGSVRMLRWSIPVAGSSNLQQAAVAEALERIMSALRALEDRNERFKHMHAGLSSAFEPAIRSIVEEIVINGSLPENYDTTLRQILQSLGAFYDERSTVHDALKSIERELSLLHRQWLFEAARSCFSERQAGILIAVSAESSGHGLLQCGYQVPCAQWRPQHEAHLTAEEKVMLITYGVVWQNSGEEWRDVNLTLSTAMPSLGLDAVLPDEDLLRLREKTREERKYVKVEARDHAIETTGAEEPSGEPPLPSDGGETQLYRVPDKVTVPGEGKPSLIRLGSREMVAETAHTATPELSCSVFLVSELKNRDERPILAGPVSLHRAGAYIGMGALEFVGSNETFHLWWGSEDLIRIDRYIDEKEEDATLMAPRKITRTVTLQVRNLAGDDNRFTIRERIPVSELEQVRVKLRKAPPGSTAPDNNGFIVIDVSVGPREEKKYEYIYGIEVDRDVQFSGI